MKGLEMWAWFKKNKTVAMETHKFSFSDSSKNYKVQSVSSRRAKIEMVAMEITLPEKPHERK